MTGERVIAFVSCRIGLRLSTWDHSSLRFLCIYDIDIWSVVCGLFSNNPSYPPSFVRSSVPSIIIAYRPSLIIVAHRIAPLRYTTRSHSHSHVPDPESCYAYRLPNQIGHTLFLIHIPIVISLCFFCHLCALLALLVTLSCT